MKGENDPKEEEVNDRIPDETHVHDGILFFLRFYRSIVSVSTLQELTFHLGAELRFQIL